MKPGWSVKMEGDTLRLAEGLLGVCILDLIGRDGMTSEALRELVDAKNAHASALDLATLAALKAAHQPVLARSLARAEAVRMSGPKAVRP